METILESFASTNGNYGLITTEKKLTWREMWDLSSKATAWANAHGKVISCLFTNSHESLASLVGILRAGGVAASLPLPQRGQPMPEYAATLQKLLLNIECEVVATSREFAPLLEAAGITVTTFDEICSYGGVPVESAGGVFLQFTSGSTGDPKGVPVSLESLYSHAKELTARQNVDTKARNGSMMRSAIWLPTSHDLCLAGFVMTYWTNNADLLLRQPLEFIQNPLSWIDDLSDFKAGMTAAPNFALELVLKAAERSDKRWDLSDLQAIQVAGEMVNPATLRRFQERFGPHGLKENVLGSGYGMAEATLAVATTTTGERWKTSFLDAEELGAGRLVPVGSLQDGLTAVRPDGLVVEFVSCGVPYVDITQDEDFVLHVDGPNVFKGYYRQEKRTAPHNTRDLGLITEGEIVVAGRADEVVIVRGKNLFPQDVERLCEGLVRAGCAAAVPDGHGGLAIVAEANYKVEPKEAASEIRRLVSKGSGIGPSRVVFVEQNTLKKTTSGKLQRRAIAAGIQAGSLQVVHEESFGKRLY
jgi:acyl-CoA synthetase (AMP-forming)/AMP-acid ligase II